MLAFWTTALMGWQKDFEALCSWEQDVALTASPMWTWDSARSPTTGLLGRQEAMPDVWGWAQGKSRFWKNVWILQSSPVPRAGDADIAPAGCIPWIDTRTIIETGQWFLPLSKVSPHPMSRIMVKAAYLFRIPLSIPSGMVQFRWLPVLST